MLIKINLDITYKWGNYQYFKTARTFKISFIENITHTQTQKQYQIVMLVLVMQWAYNFILLYTTS